MFSEPALVHRQYLRITESITKSSIHKADLEMGILATQFSEGPLSKMRKTIFL